jgi:hypothetical protein
MASIYSDEHFDGDRMTATYDAKYKLHTVVFTDHMRMHLNTSELARLHYEIEGALRHAYEEEGAANGDE